jgi:putative ABC transport system substrate-binding protein
MDRRRFLLTSLAGAVARPPAAGAQQTPKLPRVGILSEGDPGPNPTRERFESGLREHGYVPGTNVVLERRFADGRLERLADMAAELVRLGVDVIVAPSERGAIAARQATTAIPIVMVVGVDPLGQGLTRSLARPDGNVTGFTADPGSDLIAKRLQLLREFVPSTRTIALLAEPLTGSAARFKPLEEAARAANVSLVKLNIRRPVELAGAFAAMTRARAGGLLVSGASVLYLSRRDISELALKHRLPAIYPLRDYTEVGGLVSYGVDVLDLFRRSGAYVGRILKGAKPSDLPIEQPTTFQLVINLKTAKALDLTIPPSLLARADQVIE